eukprot:gene24978-32547_t
MLKSSRRLLTTAIQFTGYGNPGKVLKIETLNLTPAVLKPNDISVKMLAAPINPADINFIEGVYGIKANFPAFAGNEGVAVVEKVGEKVNSFQLGDWVIPSGPSIGTWRKHIVSNENDFIKIDKTIPVAYAATLSVNPCTAYCLLKSFIDLKPGDVIIQNGANSMVGIAVIQIARELGIKTVNIIRSDRPNIEHTLTLLANLGGDINVPDNYFASSSFNEILKELPACKLAFNSTGGSVVTDIARVLAPGATIVTYGGTSKKPIALPLDLLTYKQITLKGFWISKWYDENSLDLRKKILGEISQLIRENKLIFFYELHDFDDFYYALEKSSEPYRLRKVVLNVDYPDRFKEHDSKPESDYSIFDAPVA